VTQPGAAHSEFAKEIDEIKEDIAHVYRSYSNENNHIYYKPVPPESELVMPEAKTLCTPTPWVPPQPAFTSL
jgi:hypothetical protein